MKSKKRTMIGLLFSLNGEWILAPHGKLELSCYEDNAYDCYHGLVNKQDLKGASYF